MRMVAQSGTPAAMPIPVTTLPIIKTGAELATIHITEPTCRGSVEYSEDLDRKMLTSQSQSIQNRHPPEVGDLCQLAESNV